MRIARPSAVTAALDAAEAVYGHTPGVGRARENVARTLALLDRASAVLSDESGMVVCWHEYDEADLLRCECAQCLVGAAFLALSGGKAA